MVNETTFQEFLVAIDVGDDAKTEELSLQIDSSLESELIQLAIRGELDQRWWAVRTLAHCGKADSIESLILSLTDPDSELRATTALALGHLHQRVPAAITPHLELLVARLADEDGFVRQSAADALSMCGDDAVDVLAKAMQSNHDGVRSRAAYALHKIATMRTAPILFQHLNDPNYLVRSHAYEALDELGLLDNVLVTFI
ncbi:HEAT repeat domain-containing protein [Chloroflexi bacterium TSY]|nr:HEAT repeat domain-containing protein [Chloroflexi bacterium TSY]